MCRPSGLQVSEVACCARGPAEQVFGFIRLAGVPRLYGVPDQGPDWFAEQLLRGREHAAGVLGRLPGAPGG